MTPQGREPGQRVAATGFTLVEILVVVSIVTILAGIVLTVMARALRTSETQATRNLLRSLSTAIEQFHADFSYYPPVLSDDVQLMDGPQRLTVVDDDRIPPSGASNAQQALEELQRSRFGSAFSLTVYLAGVGDVTGPNVGDSGETPNQETIRDDGVEGPGLRDPGTDRSWGGAWDRTQQQAPVAGRVFGPYVDLGSGGNVRLILDPNEDGDPVEAAGLYLLIDRWKTPIRYYRKWPTRDRDDPTRPSLERIPVELFTEAERFASDSPFADPTSATALLRAPYALLSAGKDGLFFDNGASDRLWGLPMSGDFVDMTRSGYANTDEFSSLTSTGEAARQAFVRSVTDNILVTP